jgi:hypothetical protein
MKRDAAMMDHAQKSDEDQMRALKEKYNKFKKKSGR